MAVALAALVWILGVFANLPGIGETAAQNSPEVYRRVYNGWKWWHVYCARCHGENALGTPLAPNLIDPNKRPTDKKFLEAVREGVPTKGMPAWNQLLDDKQIMDIYTYVVARTERVLPPGRPDEVGANGGPWVPPEGWPQTGAAVDPAPLAATPEVVSSPKVASDKTASAAVSTANPLTEAFRSRYQSVRLNLIETAEVMPKEHYGFRLTPAQRSFSGWIVHTAVLNYNSCARMQGVPRPQTDHLDQLTGKEALQAALRESFDFCDTALQQMNDERALTESQTGERTTLPVQAMLGLLSSLNSHYGNLVGYLRSRGIVPPSTVRAQSKRSSSQ
jgi:mono/diheme cytochrome c family protein